MNPLQKLFIAFSWYAVNAASAAPDSTAVCLPDGLYRICKASAGSTGLCCLQAPDSNSRKLMASADTEESRKLDAASGSSDSGSSDSRVGRRRHHHHHHHPRVHHHPHYYYAYRYHGHGHHGLRHGHHGHGYHGHGHLGHGHHGHGHHGHGHHGHGHHGHGHHGHGHHGHGHHGHGHHGHGHHGYKYSKKHYKYHKKAHKYYRKYLKYHKKAHRALGALSGLTFECGENALNEASVFDLSFDPNCKLELDVGSCSVSKEGTKLINSCESSGLVFETSKATSSTFTLQSNGSFVNADATSAAILGSEATTRISYYPLDQDQPISV